MDSIRSENGRDSRFTPYDRTGRALFTILCILLIFVGIMVGLTVYSVLFRPEPKIDSRFVTVTESLLNLQNRVERIDQENQILFRMLRNENGLSETTSPLPVSVVPVLPPVKPLVKPLGDVINADTFGDKQE